MVEDNKQLASRIDGDLQTAHQEVNLLRQELADTNRRITQLQAHNQNHDDTNLREDEDSGSDTTVNLNGSNKYHSESSSNQLAEEMSQLRVDNEKLLTRNRSLQREVEELRRVKTIMEEDVQLKPQINQMTMELTHAKEALSGRPSGGPKSGSSVVLWVVPLDGPSDGSLVGLSGGHLGDLSDGPLGGPSGASSGEGPHK
ncbi:hypothetical protein C7M84_005265 [Penaeus vannamei]|uniref:Uncharacterized protein n=1 Tax=Penaeus vannamei TaxID=6689 RepID=A0A3R7PT02_PENVA|nr:hypothetical protein C7M84_005265 [Penaeus vannamei]